MAEEQGTVFPISGGMPQALADGEFINPARTPHGFQITKDWVQAYIDAGHGYHMQIGTEDAPVAMTTSIDDALVWAVIDAPADTVIIPFKAEAHISLWSTCTIALAMLEVDADRVRYSSGGTAYVPENLNTMSSNTVPSGVVAYVGTDVTTAAKSAVPASMEIARQVFSEDARATAEPADFNPFIWNGPSPIVGDAASFLFHFGSATADASGYGLIQFVAMTKAQFLRT